MLKRPSILFSTKSLKKDNIALRLLNLNMNGPTIERESTIKFLRVWIGQNLMWRDHIHTVKNKIANILGSYIKESITSIRIASSKSTLLIYMLIYLCKHSMG